VYVHLIILLLKLFNKLHLKRPKPFALSAFQQTSSLLWLCPTSLAGKSIALTLFQGPPKFSSKAYFRVVLSVWRCAHNQ